MVQFVALGYFPLGNGFRQSTTTTTPSGNKVRWHNHYKTAFRCANGTTLPAALHVYAPAAANQPYPHGTVALVLAKVHTPLPAAQTDAGNVTVMMEAVTVAPCPGDPNSDEYDDSLPTLPAVYAFCTGTVLHRAI